MKPRLILAPDALAHSLMAEMTDALQHMEAGDYDGAFQIIEARCRPDDPATDIRPHHADNLDLRRTMAEMVRHMPEGLLRKHHVLALEVAASLAMRAIAQDDQVAPDDRIETAIGAARAVADFGVSLEWDYDLRPDELEAAIEELKAVRTALQELPEG